MLVSCYILHTQNKTSKAENCFHHDDGNGQEIKDIKGTNVKDFLAFKESEKSSEVEIYTIWSSIASSSLEIFE